MIEQDQGDPGHAVEPSDPAQVGIEGAVSGYTIPVSWAVMAA
jgi:hypothetical protein